MTLVFNLYQFHAGRMKLESSFSDITAMTPIDSSGMPNISSADAFTDLATIEGYCSHLGHTIDSDGIAERIQVLVAVLSQKVQIFKARQIPGSVCYTLCQACCGYHVQQSLITMILLRSSLARALPDSIKASFKSWVKNVSHEKWKAFMKDISYAALCIHN